MPQSVYIKKLQFVRSGCWSPVTRQDFPTLSVITHFPSANKNEGPYI